MGLRHRGSIILPRILSRVATSSTDLWFSRYDCNVIRGSLRCMWRRGGIIDLYCGCLEIPDHCGSSGCIGGHFRSVAVSQPPPASWKHGSEMVILVTAYLAPYYSVSLRDVSTGSSCPEQYVARHIWQVKYSSSVSLTAVYTSADWLYLTPQGSQSCRGYRLDLELRCRGWARACND